MIPHYLHLTFSNNLKLQVQAKSLKYSTIKMKSHALIRQQFVLVIFQNLLVIYDFLSQRKKSTALSSCEKKKVKDK